MLKPILFLPLLLWAFSAAGVVPLATNWDNRVLLLDNSTMDLPTAKATLIVSPLTPTNGSYIGNFKVKVFPFFFKSDHGWLNIKIPEPTRTDFNRGKTVSVTGTSVSAKNGTVRHIQITVTPKDGTHGCVTLWFMVGEQKMIFTTTYHFAEKNTTTAQLMSPISKSPLAFLQKRVAKTTS